MRQTINIFSLCFTVSTVALSIAASSFAQDRLETKGWYQNYSYGFKIHIPAGLVGLWNSAGSNTDSVTMSDHGRFIPLTDSDGINVFACFTREPDLPLAAVLLEQLKSVEGRADTLSFVLERLDKARLGNLPAFHYRMKYEKQGTRRASEGLIALARGENIRFLIELDVQLSRYADSREFFTSTCRSWSRTKRR